jgi:purine-binding chemotaxis protein CheW
MTNDHPLDTELKCGVFFVGDLQVALDIEELREVLPFRGLEPLPSNQPGLVGGVNLRGVLVPVLDLQKLSGFANLKPEQYECVVIVQKENELFGVLAKEIVDVFKIKKEKVDKLHQHDYSPLLFVTGSFLHPLNQSLVNLLNLDALRSLPDMTFAFADRMIVDESTDHKASSNNAEDHMVLFRCNTTPFTLSSSLIDSTLHSLEIKTTAITHGFCLGETLYKEWRIPAIDLACYLGLTDTPNLDLKDAIVFRFDEGYIAFCVDQILDVVCISPDIIRAIGAAKAMFKGHCSGILPTKKIPRDSIALDQISQEYLFVLDSQELHDNHELGELVKTRLKENKTVGRRSLDDLNHQEQAESTQLITYWVGGFEAASKIDDILEIIPLRSASEISVESGGVFVILHMNDPVPVRYLADPLGIAREPITSESCILLVKQDEQKLGFVIPKLMSIDEVSAEKLQHANRSGIMNLQSCSDAWSYTSIGTQENKRMCPIFDLSWLAKNLLETVS